MISASTKEDNALFTEKTQYQPGANFKGIKLVGNGEILAMVGYDYWTNNSVQMHVWFGDGSAAMKGRHFLQEAFRYPFEICDRGIVIAATPAHNTASLTLQRFLGFEKKYRIQDGWAIGDDMIISELRKPQCIWLRPIP